MSFPVTIAGTTFTLADFENYAFVEGIPDSIEKLQELAATSVTFPVTGPFTITDSLIEVTLPPGTPSLQGSQSVPFMRVVGNASNYADLFFVSQDLNTGLLQLYNGAPVIGQVVGSGTFGSGTLVLLAKEHQAAPSYDRMPVGTRRGGLSTNHLRKILKLFSVRDGLRIEEDFQVPRAKGPWSDGQWCDDLPATVQAEMGTKLSGTMALDSTSYGYLRMGYGQHGFMSPISPGDFYYQTTVYLNAVVATPTVSSNVALIGLRGEASSYDRIFDRYGIGVEVGFDATGVTYIQGVVVVNGLRRTLPLTCNPGRYNIAIWGDHLTRQVHFGMSNSSDTTLYPQDGYNYQGSLSFADWPDKTAAFLHPAYSFYNTVGVAPGTEVLYVDRLFLVKEQERL